MCIGWCIVDGGSSGNESDLSGETTVEIGPCVIDMFDCWYFLGTYVVVFVVVHSNNTVHSEFLGSYIVDIGLGMLVALVVVFVDDVFVLAVYIVDESALNVVIVEDDALVAGDMDSDYVAFEFVASFVLVVFVDCNCLVCVCVLVVLLLVLRIGSPLFVVLPLVAPGLCL